jgi:hypothetical protein
MTAQLTAQRRLMQKLADRVDRVTQADRLFFERRPDRQHRVRLASWAEIEQNQIISGRPWGLPPGYRHFVTIRNIADGVRLRNFIINVQDAETDMSEMDACEVFESASTETTRAIEARLRAAARARG